MKRIKLSEVSTLAPKDQNKDDAKARTKENRKAIGELQNVMQAQGKHSLLLVLQGMDASGKDGAVKNVFTDVSPSGIRVQSFKKPTDEEKNHDFIWRVHQHVPEKGMIQVFNRSHYEDVLIQRVHQWIDEETVYQRFEHINHFEKLVQSNDTLIIKVFLHTSKEEQLIQLNERKSDPQKYWKHNPNDFEERKHWDKYMQAYEDVFQYCGPDLPWHIVPSDLNWYKEYMLSELIRTELEKLQMTYPPLNE